MNSFIDNLKTNIQDISAGRILIFVIGNESCDLDSAVSSIVYAYFLTWCQTHQSTSKENREIIIPILNIPKEDLPLKTEVTHLFKKVHIKLDKLICRDDIDIKLLSDKFKLQVVLVDHHILSDLLSFLTGNVTIILDHRPKDESSWKYTENIKSNITTVGSCTTLVCNEILSNKIGNKFLNQNKDVVHLLHGTIVLDTANFLPSADRARPLDFKMAEELEKVLETTDKNNYRSDVFSELLNARTDCSTLNSLQLLSRDLKIINKLPLPGLAMLVHDYLKRGDSISALKTFCERNQTSTVLLIGLVVIDNVVSRDLAVYSLIDCELHREVEKALQEASDPSLNLEETHSHGLSHCNHFVQKNVKASRKQIVPIIQRIFRN